MKDLAAISFNFDSIAETVGFPNGFRDPSFTEVADRFLAIADRYNFKYTFFVIGRDLEQEVARKSVRQWISKGHEVGNHSWSHHMDLGSLPKDQILEEIRKTHNAITEVTGIEPKGFISPAWSSSKALREVLCELNYDYDTSSAPSWLMYPALAKIAYNHLGTEKFWRSIHRKDYLRFLLDSKEAHTFKKAGGKELQVLPLPTGMFGTACWHTLGFMFGWDFHHRLMKSCLDKRECFYYVIHPADLTVATDIERGHRHHFARMEVSLEEKLQHFEESIQIILSSGRRLVTLSELSRESRRYLN